MSVSSPPPATDGPFGLAPNVAAGLAYLLGIIGGIVMFLGGGTNRFAKWSAAQSIVLWGTYIVLYIAIAFVFGLIHMWALGGILSMCIGLVWFILWIWTTVTG